MGLGRRSQLFGNLFVLYCVDIMAQKLRSCKDSTRAVVIRSYLATLSSKVINGSFPLFGTVQYGTQLFPFPLSEVVNATKIANRTIPLFWYPSAGVPSTAKGTKRFVVYLTGIRGLMNLLFVPGHRFGWAKKLMFNFIFILNFTVVQHWICGIRLTKLFALSLFPII